MQMKNLTMTRTKGNQINNLKNKKIKIKIKIKVIE